MRFTEPHGHVRVTGNRSHHGRGRMTLNDKDAAVISLHRRIVEIAAISKHHKLIIVSAPRHGVNTRHEIEPNNGVVSSDEPLDALARCAMQTGHFSDLLSISKIHGGARRPCTSSRGMLT